MAALSLARSDSAQPVTVIDRFLASARCRKPTTRRTYGSALDRIAGHLGADRPLREVTGDELGEALTVLWATEAPATWKQRRAALGSFLAWCARNGYPAPAQPASVERQPEQRDETRAIDRAATALYTNPLLATGCATAAGVVSASVKSAGS